MSGHSERQGTEHRGNVITSMHGLPIQLTPVQEAMQREPACPDWHDHREHIAGTMPHGPSACHIVYANGKRVAVLPAPAYHLPNGDVSEFGRACIQTAREIEQAWKQRARIIGADPTEVTLDAWAPGRAIATWVDTMPDDRLTPSVYRESIEALATA